MLRDEKGNKKHQIDRKNEELILVFLIIYLIVLAFLAL